MPRTPGKLGKLDHTGASPDLARLVAGETPTVANGGVGWHCKQRVLTGSHTWCWLSENVGASTGHSPSQCDVEDKQWFCASGVLTKVGEGQMPAKEGWCLTVALCQVYRLKIDQLR